MLLDCGLRNNLENAPTKALIFLRVKELPNSFDHTKNQKLNENGRLNADISTKMGTKLPKIPIIVFQIHNKLIAVENGGGG